MYFFIYLAGQHISWEGVGWKYTHIFIPSLTMLLVLSQKVGKVPQRHFKLNARPDNVFWHHVFGVVTLLLGDKVVHLNVQLTPFIPSSTGD